MAQGGSGYTPLAQPTIRERTLIATRVRDGAAALACALALGVLGRRCKGRQAQEGRHPAFR